MKRHDIITEADAAIGVTVDARDPDAGNMSHKYDVTLDGSELITIPFQHGPIKEVGRNGLTNEVLIAIVIDRLDGAQEGPFRCRENACAKTHLEEALHWLQQRTIDRQRRGVEGRNQA